MPINNCLEEKYSVSINSPCKLQNILLIPLGPFPPNKPPCENSKLTIPTEAESRTYCAKLALFIHTAYKSEVMI